MKISGIYMKYLDSSDQNSLLTPIDDFHDKCLNTLPLHVLAMKNLKDQLDIHHI